MDIATLNSLQLDYRDRFSTELDFLVMHSTLAEILFANSNVLFADQQKPYVASLYGVFSCSFDGLGLALSRVWDERQKYDPTLLSIPQLVKNFEPHNYLGCNGLKEGGRDREAFNSIYSDPIKVRLRVARTEAFAHSVQLGKSSDRRRSDIVELRGFGLVNSSVLDFSFKTMNLLASLVKQLSFSAWKGGKALDVVLQESRQSHIDFLRYFSPEVSLDDVVRKV